MVPVCSGPCLAGAKPSRLRKDEDDDRISIQEVSDMRLKRPESVMYIRFQKDLQAVAFPSLLHWKAVDDAP